MTRREKAIALLRQQAAAKQALQSLPVLLRQQEPVQRRQTRKEYRHIRDRVALVEQALSILNPEERLLLYRFFIQPTGHILDQLRMELGVEQSTLYRRRDKALHKFAAAVFGPSRRRSLFENTP